MIIGGEVRQPGLLLHTHVCVCVLFVNTWPGSRLLRCFTCSLACHNTQQASAGLQPRARQT